MTERQFWWASFDGREPQVVEVAESHGIRFVFATGTDVDLNEDKVRLIERVLPAGRAAAVVDKLEDIVGSWDIDQMTEYAQVALAILQAGESEA